MVDRMKLLCGDRPEPAGQILPRSVKPQGNFLLCTSSIPSFISHMLSTGAITVPSACLRCQLRQTISCTGKRVSSTRVNATWRTRRPFSASHRGCVDAAFDGTEANIESHEHNKLSEHPLGRIYGKPGRRHRETTARLSRDSLQKPFEVVVLRDVPDTVEPGQQTSSDATQIAKPSTIDASQIARDVLDQGRTATEAEILTSIDALQPRTTIVDDEEYTAIAKSLIDSHRRSTADS